MRVLFDTNVVLDVLSDRPPFAAPAVRLFAEVEAGRIAGYLCASSVAIIYHFVRKFRGAELAAQTVQQVLSLFEIAPVNRAVLANAAGSGFEDFEDAAIAEAAKLIEAQGLVTRNAADFRRTALPIYSPEEMLSIIHQEKRKRKKHD